MAQEQPETFIFITFGSWPSNGSRRFPECPFCAFSYFGHRMVPGDPERPHFNNLRVLTTKCSHGVPRRRILSVCVSLKAFSPVLFCLKALSHILFSLKALSLVLFELEHFLTYCLNYNTFSCTVWLKGTSSRTICLRDTFSRSV
jgi:hypothetical protein